MIWSNFGLNKERLMVFRQMGAFGDRAGQKEYEKNAEFNHAVKRLVECSLGKGVAEFHLPKLSFSKKKDQYVGYFKRM